MEYCDIIYKYTYKLYEVNIITFTIGPSLTRLL